MNKSTNIPNMHVSLLHCDVYSMQKCVRFKWLANCLQRIEPHQIATRGPSQMKKFSYSLPYPWVHTIYACRKLVFYLHKANQQEGSLFLSDHISLCSKPYETGLDEALDRFSHIVWLPLLV
jgi:hypothetical protein